MNGILIPQNIFVGDSAQFFLLLSEYEISALAAKNLVVGNSVPLKDVRQNDVMTIQDIRIIEREGGIYLHITFTAWETGDINFPSLPFLQPKNRLPVIHVSSLLEGIQEQTLQPPKPPLLIPGTDYLLYGLTAGGIGCLLLLTVGISLIIRKIKRKTVPCTAKRRLNMLQRKLKLLHKEVRKIQGRAAVAEAAGTGTMEYERLIDSIRQWYAVLDRSIRIYLAALFAAEGSIFWEYREEYFTSATYTELIGKLAVLFDRQKGISDLFGIFYTMLEKQRFGSSSSELVRDYAAVAYDLLKKIPYITEKTEAEYAALVQLRKESEEIIQQQGETIHTV